MTEKPSNRQPKAGVNERPPVPSIDTQDPVDVASYDSFPASDPPAHTGSHAGTGDKRKDTETEKKSGH